MSSMKSKILFLFLLFYSETVFSQNAVIQSFDHAARWVNEKNFPSFASNKYLQDTLLLLTSEALKRKFNVKEMSLPNEIAYKYYTGFGKPKIKNLKKAADSRDYNIAILSFITRDTYNSKVYWNMEIVVQQNGAVSFSNQTGHELENFAPSINSELEPINESEFIRVFSVLMDELLDSTKKSSEKIIIGSQESIEDSISIAIPNAVKLKMITNGNFMANSKFSISVEKEQKILSNVVYTRGKESSKGKGNFSGWLLANATSAALGDNSSSSYMKKTRETRTGNLEFSTGEIHVLKMEWEQNTEKEVVNDADNDGLIATRTGYSEQLSPMIIQIIKNDSLYGNLTYFKEGEIFAVEGEIQNHTINVTYAPSSSVLRVIENNETIVIVEMYNVNPENPDSFSGNKKSNKIFFPPTKSKLPEWYNVYVANNINQADTANYMEAIFCLFFGIGNHT